MVIGVSGCVGDITGDVSSAAAGETAAVNASSSGGSGGKTARSGGNTVTGKGTGGDDGAANGREDEDAAASEDAGNGRSDPDDASSPGTTPGKGRDGGVVSSEAGASRSDAGTTTPAKDAGSAPPASTDAGSSSDPVQTCVDLVNGYRATLGIPALTRWTAEESCTNGQAQADYVAKKAHSAFGQCNEFGQCECPGFSGWSGTPASTIAKCLAAMWAEGPGGGHYDIMSSKDYTMIACGFYSAPDGTTTSTQDYK